MSSAAEATESIARRCYIVEAEGRHVPLLFCEKALKRRTRASALLKSPEVHATTHVKSCTHVQPL